MSEMPEPTPKVRFARIRNYIDGLSTPGLIGAVAASLWSYTPSLLPREWWIQGVVTALCAISAYGMGALVGWVARGFDLNDRLSNPTLRSWTRRVLAVITPVGWIAMNILGLIWQVKQRDLLGMPSLGLLGGVGFVLSVVMVPLFFVPRLGFARLIRKTATRIGRFLGRVLPRQTATVLAVGITVLLLHGLISGLLVRSVTGVLDNTFRIAAELVDPGSEPPASPLRSGSATSTVPWEDLGREGRRFVTRGPSVDDLLAFEQSRATGRDDTQVKEPIRVYAGLTEDAHTAADAVVAELDRTDAWERESLLVISTTGSGWVDESIASSFEYLGGGDTALAAMQYSYLPSWMAFLGDRETPPNATRILFSAISQRWAELPPEGRPKVYVAGLSLGSFGMQSAFADYQDLLTRTDGALFAGTPYFVPMWLDLTEARDPGTTEVEPVVDSGHQVRFYTGDPAQLAGEWDQPRVAYLQHGTDGTTWWSPSLWWTEPDWMDEQRAPGVMDEVAWFPVTSFWQFAFDLFFAAGPDVPMGTGHHFKLEYVDAFAAINEQAGWTDADTQLLREVISAQHD